MSVANVPVACMVTINKSYDFALLRLVNVASVHAVFVSQSVDVPEKPHSVLPAVCDNEVSAKSHPFSSHGGAFPCASIP